MKRLPQAKENNKIFDKDYEKIINQVAEKLRGVNQAMINAGYTRAKRRQIWNEFVKKIMS